MGKFLKKYYSIIYIGIALVCFIMARLIYSPIIEKVYATSVNRYIRQYLSLITGLVPFSIGEFVVFGHIIAIPIIFVILIRRIIQGRFFRALNKLIAYIALIYIAFMFLWGFNYSRSSLSVIMSLEIKASDTTELYNLSRDLIIKANALRDKVMEDGNGVMKVNGGYQSVFKRAGIGYNEIGKLYKELSGNYGSAKSIIVSDYMLYTGITGIYFPFTAEANVNVAIPDLFLPATVLHEMAHQRGFASEDEANYLAYLTAINHPDYDFQYSGAVHALVSSMNALYAFDNEKAKELSELYSLGLKRDLIHYDLFWKKYEGKISEISDSINDAYLKGNGENDGTYSYGRMVDLLLAHYRKYGTI